MPASQQEVCEETHTGILVPGGVIEHPKHGHNAIGVAIGTPDIAACRPDVMHGQANTASTLGYACTLFQGVIDALQPANTSYYLSMFSNSPASSMHMTLDKDLWCLEATV